MNELVNGRFERVKRYHKGYWYIDYSRDKDDRFYNLVYSEGDYYNTEPYARVGGGLILDYPDNPYYDERDVERTVKAFKRARQARFEHGEKPEVIR